MEICILKVSCLYACIQQKQRLLNMFDFFNLNVCFLFFKKVSKFDQQDHQIKGQTNTWKGATMDLVGASWLK